MSNQFEIDIYQKVFRGEQVVSLKNFWLESHPGMIILKGHT